MANVNIPAPTGQEKVEDLIDLMIRYKKELDFLLLNLNGQNVPIIDSLVEDIDGNSTQITQNSEQISLNANDISGNASDIVLNANQISLNVSDIDGNSSAITLNSNNINLRVEKDDVINQINISTEGIVISANQIDLDGIVRVADVIQIGKDSETGVINFPKSNDPYNSFISSDNITYGLYIHSKGDMMASSYDDLFLSGQDKIELESQSSPTNGVSIILNSGVGIDIYSPYGVDFNSCNITNVADITADDCTFDTLQVENGANTTNTYVTTPYYAANFCYVDGGSGALVIRNSSGSELGTITYD
jgi:hypothetical protein